MSEIGKTLGVSGAYLLNKWAGLPAYDDVAALVRLVESLEGRLVTARAEGFAAAREMGAAHVERILGKKVGDEIRAMQDERAGEGHHCSNCEGVQPSTCLYTRWTP